jgi:hypothetical protein
LRWGQRWRWYPRREGARRWDGRRWRWLHARGSGRRRRHHACKHNGRWRRRHCHSWGHHAHRRRVGEELMGAVSLRERVLCGQETFSGRAVTFAFRVFFERVRDGDGAVAEVLTIHGFDGSVGCFKTGEVDESKAFGVASVRISHYLWCLQNHSKRRKCIIEQLLIYFWI